MANEIQLKSGTIKHLQKYIDRKIKQRGFEDESLHERLLLLTEEIGELVKACRKISGMNIKYQVGEEITDVINMIFCVGIKLNIDIEKEFYDKEARIDKRFYKRSTKKHEEYRNYGNEQ
ncbi:MAG: hypothetical protein U9M90_00765 [Patescibacteria group bacterium]|nr:hypothetical protein [Patescibacteria group bacterium]